MVKRLGIVETESEVMTPKATNPYPWLDDLPQLNTLLAANNLMVSADVWVRVYDLLIAQYQQNRLPQDPAALESALCGLMVTSAEQQQQFKAIYQQWLASVGSEAATKARQHEATKHAQQYDEIARQAEAQRKNRSRVKIWFVAATLLALIIASVIYFWPKPTPEPPPEPPQKVTSTSSAPVTVSKPIMALQPTPLRQDLLPKAQSSGQQYLLDVIGNTLPFLPIGLLAFFMWAKWQRWQEVLSQQKGDPNDPLNAISLANETASTKNLFSSPLLSSALRTLHNPIKVPSQSLDMPATAEATAKAGGYFTPKYQQRSYVPPCIMMISYQHGQDQASGLALLMQQRLVHAGLEVYTYLFQGTPEHLYTLEGMNSTTLEDVTLRYPQGNLLLISDPDIYLSAWSGELQPWANAISQWQQRALLTTRPTTAAMRQVFNALQLHTASLSSEGLRQISQTLAGVRKASEVSTTQEPLPPVLARLNAYECGEDVSKEDQEEQIDALHLFCDPQTFRLLTVVAAYPELHWPLTQRIESKLCSQQLIGQREQRLLNLLRLPWLRVGRIPKWLRLYCYQQQSPEQHQETQTIYIELFHEAEILAAGISHSNSLELPFNAKAAKQPKQQAFLNWLKTLKQAQESSLDNSLWEDQIFVNTLWGKPKELDVPLTKQLAVRLPRGRWGRLYPRIALWSVAAVLAGVVLQQAWQSQGKETLQAMLPPAGLSPQLANSTIEILINKPDTYETGQQLQQFEQQKQAAKLLTEALKKQGVSGEIKVNITNNQLPSLSGLPSYIIYADNKVNLAELIAKQFSHITWGSQPELLSDSTVFNLSGFLANDTPGTVIEFNYPNDPEINVVKELLKSEGYDVNVLSKKEPKGKFTVTVVFGVEQGQKTDLSQKILDLLLTKNTNVQLNRAEFTSSAIFDDYKAITSVTESRNSNALQIQLNTLIQAGSTFSDKAKPLDDIDNETMGILLNSSETSKNDINTYVFGSNIAPFTLFSDTGKDGVTTPRMIALPAGEFLMGSPETEPDRGSDESPQHNVTLKAFAISQTEVTFEQYDAFADATKREKPSDEGWGRGQRPVINVSWNDAKAYVAWLSEQTGQVYRLPTEAEWEYAARAGTTTPFSSGNCIHTDIANYYGQLDYNDCGAKTGVLRDQSTPATELSPNPWGFYAMDGNVWEWVEDCYEDNYEGAAPDGEARQEPDCLRRVLRSGGWIDDSSGMRSANRFRFDPSGLFNGTEGFRIARAL